MRYMDINFNSILNLNCLLRYSLRTMGIRILEVWEWGKWLRHYNRMGRTQNSNSYGPYALFAGIRVCLVTTVYRNSS